MRAGLPPGPHSAIGPPRAGGQQGGSWAPPYTHSTPKSFRPHPHPTPRPPSQTGIPGAADCCRSRLGTPAGGHLCVPPHWPGGSLCPPHQFPASGSSLAPPPVCPQCGEGSRLTWGVVAQPDAAGAADAQVGHGGGQVGGAAAPAQGGVRGLLGVQGGGQGGREVQRGQVGQGPPRVEGRGHEGHVGRLIRGWEYAGGEGGEMGSGQERGCLPQQPLPSVPQCPPAPVPTRFPTSPIPSNPFLISSPSPGSPSPSQPLPALTGFPAPRRSGAGPRRTRAVGSKYSNEARPGHGGEGRRGGKQGETRGEGAQGDIPTHLLGVPGLQRVFVVVEVLFDGRHLEKKHWEQRQGSVRGEGTEGGTPEPPGTERIWGHRWGPSSPLLSESPSRKPVWEQEGQGSIKGRGLPWDHPPEPLRGAGGRGSSPVRRPGGGPACEGPR